MRSADVPARPLLVDTNVVSQIVLRERQWEEVLALIGAIVTANLDDFRLLSSTGPRILLIHPE